MDNWKKALQAEFERAEAARARGNEGQARVCARRAAGIAIREYLARQGRRSSSPSAYDLLNLMKTEPDLSPPLRQSLNNLTLRVNEEFRLPVNVDLIAEARELCRALLPEWE